MIAQAGQAAKVTVATNMAGRGTDIRLSQQVRDSGGLHVILTEYHDSRRVDRQLFGRCARQGDPGGCEAIVSLEDDVFVINAPVLTTAVRQILTAHGQVPLALLRLLRRQAQNAAERRGTGQRVRNLVQDRRMELMLAFSGRGE